MCRYSPGQTAFDNNSFGGTMGGPIVKIEVVHCRRLEYTYLHVKGSATAFTGPTAVVWRTLQANAADSAVTALLEFPCGAANDAGTVPDSSWHNRSRHSRSHRQITSSGQNFKEETRCSRLYRTIRWAGTSLERASGF